MKNGLQKIRRLAAVAALCAAALCVMMLLTAGLGRLMPAAKAPTVTAIATEGISLSERPTTDEVVLQTPEQTHPYSGENPLPMTSRSQLPALPNGCEFVSLAMVLEYYGYPYDNEALVREYCPMGEYLKTDPDKAYVGSPFAGEAGLGCNAPVVRTAANQFLQDRDARLEANYAHSPTIEGLLAYIDRGTPVILWATVDMKQDFTVVREWQAQGEQFSWLRYSHCLVLVGYTAQDFIFQDPLSGLVRYARADCESSFTALGCQAIVLEEIK